MKRYIVMSFIAVALPLSAVAQDDMYFVPTKANVEKSAHDYGMPRDTYYSGSDRSVDEYNRRGSYVQEIDSAGNDVIDFDAVRGVYPDSVREETATDYTYTRRMSRFDDYAWSDPYWEGYYAGRLSRWWYDPWYYPGWYYDPWYYGWYGDPWHYGWHGWYGHWWGGPHYAVVHRGGPTGTRNGVRGGRLGNSGRLGTARSVSSGIANRNRQASSITRNSTFNTSGRFGTSRTNTSVRSNTPTRSTSSSFGSGSFGGSRSTGSFGGGIRSGGSRGGGFGGRR